MISKVVLLVSLMLMIISCSNGERVYELPAPSLEGSMSVEEAIQARRSIREFKDAPLTAEIVGQMLWASYGITLPARRFRSVPSAGATFPSEIFLLVRDVEDIEKGIYHYKPLNHSIVQIKKGDFSQELQRMCLNQGWVGKAQCNIIISAEFQRTMGHYGQRGEMYVHQESGHIGQNIYLQAEALGLGTVAIGAFNEEQVKELLETEYRPIYIFPIGNRDAK